MSMRHVQRVEQSLKAHQENIDGEEEKVMETDERPKKSAFSAFGNESSSEGSVADEQPQPSGVKAIVVSKAARKKKNKNKNKQSATKEDEEDKVLNEIIKEVTSASSVASEQISKVHRFAFNKTSLDADREVKRKLGRALSSGAGASKSSSRAKPPRGHRIAVPTGVSTVTSTSLPRLLVTAESDWFNPPTFASGEGARMVRIEGSNEFTFEASASYRSVQLHFEELVMTMDPNELIQLIQTHPFHVDSLLQLVDVFQSASQNETAQMMLRRALFTLESWCSPQFRSALGSGEFCLSLVEDGIDCGLNGAFLRALAMSMRNAGRRDCYETAFNLSKLILSLSIDTDPCFVMLSVDYYALKSKEYQWIIDSHLQTEIESLPSASYGIALALFAISREVNSSRPRSDADEALKRALVRFPKYAELVLSSASKESPTVLPAKDELNERLCSLSFTRQQSLWTQELVGWMLDILARSKLVEGKSDSSSTVKTRSEQDQEALMKRYAQCSIPELTDKIDLIPRDELIADEQERLNFLPQQEAPEPERLPPNVNLQLNDFLLFFQTISPNARLPERQEDSQEEDEWGEDVE